VSRRLKLSAVFADKENEKPWHQNRTGFFQPARWPGIRVPGGLKGENMTLAQEAALAAAEQQLVVFELSRESYGVDIGAVNTIIRMQSITHVPRAPEFVEGVINLRGSIVPVIDLRRRFGLSAHEETKASRIVVVETAVGLVGIVVDAVTETLSLSPEAIEPPSSVVTTTESHYLRGVAKLEERLIILLAIEKLLSEAETDALGEVIEKQ
jgi:purine-binding chemotaxis protein CheW